MAHTFATHGLCSDTFTVPSARRACMAKSLSASHLKKQQQTSAFCPNYVAMRYVAWGKTLSRGPSSAFVLFVKTHNYNTKGEK